MPHLLSATLRSVPKGARYTTAAGLDPALRVAAMKEIVVSTCVRKSTSGPGRLHLKQIQRLANPLVSARSTAKFHKRIILPGGGTPRYGTRLACGLGGAIRTTQTTCRLVSVVQATEQAATHRRCLSAISDDLVAMTLSSVLRDQLQPRRLAPSCAADVLLDACEVKPVVSLSANNASCYSREAHGRREQ